MSKWRNTPVFFFFFPVKNWNSVTPTCRWKVIWSFFVQTFVELHSLKLTKLEIRFNTLKEEKCTFCGISVQKPKDPQLVQEDLKVFTSFLGEICNMVFSYQLRNYYVILFYFFISFFSFFWGWMGVFRLTGPSPSRPSTTAWSAALFMFLLLVMISKKEKEKTLPSFVFCHADTQCWARCSQSCRISTRTTTMKIQRMMMTTTWTPMWSDLHIHIWHTILAGL